MKMRYTPCPLLSPRQPNQEAISRFQCPIYVYKNEVLDVNARRKNGVGFTRHRIP
jgi:hypothetical protein